MMRRLLLIITIAFLTAVAAAWLADHPGRAIIEWEGWRIEMTAVVLALLILLLTLVMLALFRLLVWLFRDTPFAPERRRERRQRKGMEAVHKALAALAAARSRDATKFTEEAVKNLGATPLTLMLRADTARLRHDDGSLHEALTALAEREDAGLIGFRGLVSLALDKDDLRDARALAVAAETRDPDSLWVREVSYTLAVQEGRWEEARATLKELRRMRRFEPQVVDRQEAALAQAQAIEADLVGQGNEALELAREALRLDPKLTPAAILAARLANGAGRPGIRDTILKDAWAARPHPDLVAATFRGIENETPGAKLARLLDITAGAPDDDETRIAKAMLLLEAEDWTEARRALEAVAANSGTTRAFELLAILEEAGYHDHEAAARWRTKAKGDDGEASWTCMTCTTQRPHWSALCPACNSLGSMDWQRAADVPQSGLKDRPFGLLPSP